MEDKSYIIVRNSPKEGFCVFFTKTDPYDEELVRSRDEMLYRTLQIPSISGRISEFLSGDPDLQEEMFQLILAAEPSLDVIFPESMQLSLLWIAVLCCFQRSAELLVRSGANVNERCDMYFCCHRDQKWTILQRLLVSYPSEWNERFMGFVIDHGAKLETRDNNGCTVLHTAIKINRIAAVELFLAKGADVNAVANEENNSATPLLTVVRTKDVDEQTLLLLLQYGADYTFRDKRGLNLLHHLAWAPEEHANQARILIERGVSVHQSAELLDKYQPLHVAAREGKNALVKLFLKHRADINAQADRGVFPLYLAAENNHPAVLFTLVENGANVDQQTNRGNTALHVACNRKDLAKEHVRILLSAGANMNIVNNKGQTAFSKMDVLNPSIGLMIRTMAVKNGCFKRTSLSKDELRIKRYPQLLKYYQESARQFAKIKAFQKPTKTCRFFDILTKCECQISELMQDPEFRKNYRSNDCKLFHMFAKDLYMSYERSRTRVQNMTIQAKIIEAACGKLPGPIVKKIVGYVFLCRKCESKKSRPAASKSKR